MVITIILTGCNKSSKSESLSGLQIAGHINNSVETTEKLEQVFRLFKDYALFYYAMTPSTDLSGFIDKSQKISVDIIGYDGKNYKEDYFKAVNLPALTITELEENLDGFCTENLKNEFLKMTENGFFTVNENCELYISSNGFGRGIGLGMDSLYLDSIEYPDENVMIVNVISFGGKDNWNTEEDLEEEAEIKFILTENGWRIDECDINAVDFFYFYNEITCGDTILSI